MLETSSTSKFASRIIFAVPPEAMSLYACQILCFENRKNTIPDIGLEETIGQVKKAYIKVNHLSS